MASLRSVLIGLLAVAVVMTSCVACASNPAAGGVSSAAPVPSVIEPPGSWPAGLTPELQAAAVAVLAAFDNYSRVVIATQQSPTGIDGDPNQPWEPEIRKYLADPAADAVVEDTESLASGGVHVVMPMRYWDAPVTAVTANSATVVACVELGAVAAAGSHHRPVSIPVTDVPRQAATFGLRPYPEKGWLVDEENPSESPVPC